MAPADGRYAVCRRNGIHDCSMLLKRQQGVNISVNKMQHRSEDQCCNGYQQSCCSSSEDGFYSENIDRSSEACSDTYSSECDPLSQAEAVDRVEWCLQWLADKAGVNNKFTEVYEVDMLMTELASQCSNTLTPYQAHDMLITSSYDYEQGTRCLWHEQREIKVCSLAAVNIYSYILSDYLCPLYQLPLTSNHLPQQQSTPVATVVHSAPIPSPPRPMSGAGLSRGFSHSGMVRMPGGGHPGLGRGIGRGMGFGRGAGSRGMGRPSAP